MSTRTISASTSAVQPSARPLVAGGPTPLTEAETKQVAAASGPKGGVIQERR